MDVRELFGKKLSESVALIDIGSSSVGGAYAVCHDGHVPELIYTERVPIRMDSGKPVGTRMLEALDVLGKSLVEKGAPILRKETGNGHVDTVFASVSSPWQDTAVRVRTIEDPKSFIFSKQHLALPPGDNPLPKDRIRSSEYVIATLLNGYEVSNPFGKRAKRADMVILSSTLDAEVSNAIKETLKRWYHTGAVRLTAFAPLAYDVFRDLYPHEKDFLVLDVSGESTDIVFVKRGLLVDVATVPLGVATIARAAHVTGGVHADGGDVIDPARNSHFDMRVKDAQNAWSKQISDVLRGFSGRHALPRTIFLLSEEDSRDYLLRLLQSSELNSLWLREDPLNVLPSLPSHFTDYVKTKNEAVGDTFLMMLAHAYDKHRGKKQESSPFI